MNPENPLLNTGHDYLPVFSKIQPSLHIVPAITQLADELDVSFEFYEKSLEKMLEKTLPKLTFESVFDEMERIQYPLSRAWGIVNHLDGVNNSEELSNAKSQVQSRVVEAFMKFGQSDIIYNAIQMLLSNPGLSNTEKRIITDSLRNMEHSGIGLDER